MRNKILKLLKSVLGDYKETYDGNVAFKCPFCNHRKHKLSVHPKKGNWQCWVCGSSGGSLMYLLKRVNADEYYFLELASILPNNKYRFLHSEEAKTPEKKQFVHKLPDEYEPLWEDRSNFYYIQARNYLDDRGVRLEDIYKYRIGYARSGKYKKMLIFPNYDKNGILNYFTTRTFIRNNSKKFVNPPYSKDVIGFELQLNWNEPLTLVESALDAITLRRNASPLYGSYLNNSIKKAIFINNVTDLTIGLDPDAAKKAIQFADYFINYGVNVKLVNFPENTDVNNLGYKKSWEMINTTSISSSLDIFEQDIKSRL